MRWEKAKRGVVINILPAQQGKVWFCPPPRKAELGVL